LLVAQRGLEALSESGPDVGDPAPPLAWIPTEGERANKTPSKGSGIPENSCLFSIGLVIVSQE
jgi:hypothetical protein